MPQRLRDEIAVEACFEHFSFLLDFHRTLAVRVERATPEGLSGILAGLRCAEAHEATANRTERWLDFLLIRLIGLTRPIRLILFSFLQAGGG